LLAIGPAHSKDKDKKKKKQETEAAAQAQRPVPVDRQEQVEQPAAVEAPAMIGKKGKDAPPVQNIREPSRAEPRAASVDRVIEQVERRYKAKVVRADKKRSGDRQIYELRLLSDEGRVWTVRVDAETGKEI
jgi:uncharacterized membrane protein YkoI